MSRLSQIPVYVARSPIKSGHTLNFIKGLYALITLCDQVGYQPTNIKLETTSRCNLRCRFCGHTWAALRELGMEEYPDSPREQASLARCAAAGGSDMTLERFRSIIEQFPQAIHFDLQGMGEPLINPDFIPIVEYAARANKKVYFYTNATLLTRDKARAIVAANNVERITISLDGAKDSTYEFIRVGANFSRVIKNIAGLVEERNRQHVSKPYIRIAMVTTSYNVAEMPELVLLGKRLGVDEVAATFFKVTVPGLASWICSPELLRNYSQEASKIAHQNNIRFNLEFVLPEEQPSALNSKSGPSSKSCLWPWMSINISVDGSVSPCCYQPRAEVYGLGNLFETSFDNIWNSPSYKQLRRCLREQNLDGLPCIDCRDHV